MQDTNPVLKGSGGVERSTGTLFGSDGLRIEDTWPHTTLLLWRATHLVSNGEVFSSPFCDPAWAICTTLWSWFCFVFWGQFPKNGSKHLVSQLGIWHPMPCVAAEDSNTAILVLTAYLLSL